MTQEKLTDSQVNERLALAMGWELKCLPSNLAPYANTWVTPEGVKIAYKSSWKPCTDDNMLRIVRDEIYKRRLHEKFIEEMCDGAGINYNDDWFEFDAFKFMQAPCSIQARAALKVLEGASV